MLNLFILKCAAEECGANFHTVDLPVMEKLHPQVVTDMHTTIPRHIDDAVLHCKQIAEAPTEIQVRRVLFIYQNCCSQKGL